MIFQDLLGGDNIAEHIRNRNKRHTKINTHNFAKYFKLKQSQNLQKQTLAKLDPEIKLRLESLKVQPKANERLVHYLMKKNQLKIDLGVFKDGLGNKKEFTVMHDLVENYDNCKFNTRGLTNKDFFRRKMEKFIESNSRKKRLSPIITYNKSILNNKVSQNSNWFSPKSTIIQAKYQGASTQPNSPNNKLIKNINMNTKYQSNQAFPLQPNSKINLSTSHLHSQSGIPETSLSMKINKVNLGKHKKHLSHSTLPVVKDKARKTKLVYPNIKISEFCTKGPEELSFEYVNENLVFGEGNKLEGNLNDDLNMKGEPKRKGTISQLMNYTSFSPELMRAHQNMSTTNIIQLHPPSRL